MAIRMCADKALTILAVTQPGRIGWCEVWDDEAKKYMVREFVFFKPDHGGLSTWMPIDQYRDLKKRIKDENREFYEVHPHLLTRKIREKEGHGSRIREHGWPCIYLVR